MKSPEELMKRARAELLRGNRWYRRAERTMRAAIRATAVYEQQVAERVLDDARERTEQVAEQLSKSRA